MKKHLIPFIMFTLVILGGCQREPVNYLYETPEDKTSRMAWWDEARFGMFIHWGLYSIPAGEWNGTTNHAEWIRTTAEIPLETYNGFVDQFNPVNYDPEAWVKAAKRAGMKYIVITTKHHDGFCLFDSDHTDFDVMSTPCQKDLLKDLARAAHKEGIRICWYHSIMDWHHPDYLPRRGWEKDRPAEGADFARYVDYMKGQLEELVTNYGDIGVLWFDGEWEDTWTHDYGNDLYNYVRNLQPDIIINNRVDVGRSGMQGMTRPGEFAGDFGTPEQEIPTTGLPGVYWETCMTMNDNWGYNKSDNNWKSAPDLIRKLADIASKGGNFLLNVGPKADGTFPDESLALLESIGNWMDANSESIYGTSASPFRKLNFGRCTQSPRGENTRLYLHVFNWPENGLLRLPGIYNTPVSASFLAGPEGKDLEVYRIEDALNIRLPGAAPDSVNTVIVLDIAGPPDISNPPLIESPHGIFIDMLSLNITTDRQNVEIRYTLDGSIPDTTSPLVAGPVQIDQTARVIARSFRNGEAVSDTAMRLLRKVSPLAPEQPDHIEPGLIARYFEGDWDSLPDFASITPMKQINATNFSLDYKDQDDLFGFMFEGLIEIQEDGVYTFYTNSDDGSRLYINDSLVVENDGLHGLEEALGNIPLLKGLHRIKVTYFEKNGGDNLKVLYKGPGIDRMLIPARSLFHKKETAK